MLHAAGMLDYSSLKDRIMVTTAALVAAGSSLCYSMGGWPATEPFLAGGAVGLAYQSMLQANVDALPGSNAYSTRVRTAHMLKASYATSTLTWASSWPSSLGNFFVSAPGLQNDGMSVFQGIRILSDVFHLSFCLLW
jgi:hypothetical protein